jgi:phospholipase A1/A2
MKSFARMLAARPMLPFQNSSFAHRSCAGAFRRSLRSLVVALGLTVIAQAASLPKTLVAPTQELVPGARIGLRLVVLNPGVEAAPCSVPDTLRCTLRVGEQRVPLVLKSGEPHPAQVPAGGFVSLPYEGVLPEGLSGDVVLEETASAEPLRAALRVASAPAPKPGTEEPAAPGQGLEPKGVASATAFAVKLPAASALSRSFAGRLAPHDAIYFIAGTKPAVKFQFSLKYRVYDLGGNAQGRPRSLQFGYTQRSLWDITAASSPFYDTSYMPELFFESLEPMPDSSEGGLTWLGYQAGFKHESNGRDGASSRSLNILTTRSALAVGRLDGWHLLVIPEVFAYVGDLSDNRDIADYRGYGKLRLVAGKSRGPVLGFTGIPGRGWHKGSIQLDLSIPVQFAKGSFQSYFLVQYFDGYAESLRSYKERSRAVRAGFSIVR